MESCRRQALGFSVYLFMNGVTLPFTSWFRSLYLHTPVEYAPKLAWAQFGIHRTCAGLAISLAVRPPVSPAPDRV